MAQLPSKADEEFKGFVYEHFSRLGKALSSPQRLVVLNILCQGEHTVEALARHAGLTVANLSRHLQILKNANLVSMRRRGKFAWYTVPDEQTRRFYLAFKEFATGHISEIRAALQEIAASPTRLDAVGREELLKRISDGGTLIVDVRPAEEYRGGHLPGAISVPLDELEQRRAELPVERSVLAYCRDRFCILADQAVEILKAHGYLVRRAEDGVLQWQLSGLPMEE